MINLLIALLIIVYIISISSLAELYINKNIDPSFWSIILLLLPIVNTYIAIKFGGMKLSIKSFKEFLKELKEN